MAEKIIKLICQNCGKKFDRRLTEYNRNQKRGKTRVYCSSKCCGYKHHKHLRKYDNSRNLGGRKLDEFSAFRHHLRHMRAHAKRRRSKTKVNVTIGDLKSLWEKQKGRCPYTGWKLLNPIEDGRTHLPYRPDRATIDRIDSSKGYTIDNIQFVALIAQYAKHSFTEKELIDFCHAVASYRKN